MNPKNEITQTLRRIVEKIRILYDRQAVNLTWSKPPGCLTLAGPSPIKVDVIDTQ